MQVPPRRKAMVADASGVLGMLPRGILVTGLVSRGLEAILARSGAVSDKLSGGVVEGMEGERHGRC